MVLVFRWVVLLLCAVPLGVGAQTCERAIGSDECVATDAGSEEKLSRTASCDVFGTVGGRPRTREDVLINGTARVELDNGQCSLAYALPGQRVWLHIPKCASTWMRTHLHVDEDRHRRVRAEHGRRASAEGTQRAAHGWRGQEQPIRRGDAEEDEGRSRHFCRRRREKLLQQPLHAVCRARSS